MRPSNGSVLEMAWSLSAPERDEETVHSYLVRLPEGETIPRQVTEITGLTMADLTEGVSVDKLAEALAGASAEIDCAVIHYAQFEKPFLLDLFTKVRGLSDLPFRIICTHRLSKRLFPALPSQNIRATAGYFGPAVVGQNRAATHVRATRQIWNGLLSELERQGITDVAALDAFLGAKAPPQRALRYEYRLDKVKRLKLPDTPGIYKMLGAKGEVLYVGKATSLRSRVNSYFRGRKGRDKFKLEMLAQVWDLQVTACATPLEAALLESDEIKRLNPPYNVVLKTGRRHLLFYDRDFTHAQRTQDGGHPLGPFRNTNWIEPVRQLARSLATGTFEQIFWEPLPETDLRAGFDLFVEQHGLAAHQLTTPRALLAFGCKLWRAHQKALRLATETTDEAAVASEEEEAGTLAEDNDLLGDEAAAPVLTPEDIAGKFERLLMRAGRELRRARQLTRLLNARITVLERTLEFHRGHLGATAEAPRLSPPWLGLEVDTFDRMSILRSELDRRPHHIADI